MEEKDKDEMEEREKDHTGENKCKDVTKEVTPPMKDESAVSEWSQKWSNCAHLGPVYVTLSTVTSVLYSPKG